MRIIALVLALLVLLGMILLALSRHKNDKVPTPLPVAVKKSETMPVIEVPFPEVIRPPLPDRKPAKLAAKKRRKAKRIKRINRPKKRQEWASAYVRCMASPYYADAPYMCGGS